MEPVLTYDEYINLLHGLAGIVCGMSFIYCFLKHL